MAIAMAPFDEMDPGPLGPPRVVKVPPHMAVKNTANTECNYLVLFFIAGLFIMALVD
jgi:hypothetical protein